MVDLFVSHSSRDIEVVRLLVGLLRNALNLRPDQIRCTSLDGYRLPAGAQFGDSLRKEVVGTAVLIGLISSRSFESAYVLFELGARWGAQKPIIPLLAPGTDPQVLSGPIAELNALRCDSAGQLHQLIDEISKALKLTPVNPAAYQEDIDVIIEYAKTLPAVSAPQRSAADAVGEAESVDEEHHQLRMALDVLLDVLKVNDHLMENHGVLSDYEDFLVPYAAVASASEQAIAGVEASDARWLAINARVRDVARRYTGTVGMLKYDALWFHGDDLRQLPVLNIPKFAAALIHPDNRYSNLRMRDHLLACARVAHSLGQEIDVPESWPDSFFLLDYARSAGLDELVRMLEEIRSKHSLRSITDATNQLDGFCDERGIEDPGCLPARLARLLSRKA